MDQPAVARKPPDKAETPQLLVLRPTQERLAMLNTRMWRTGAAAILILFACALGLTLLYVLEAGHRWSLAAILFGCGMWLGVIMLVMLVRIAWCIRQGTKVSVTATGIRASGWLQAPVHVNWSGIVSVATERGIDGSIERLRVMDNAGRCLELDADRDRHIDLVHSFLALRASEAMLEHHAVARVHKPPRTWPLDWDVNLGLWLGSMFATIMYLFYTSPIALIVQLAGFTGVFAGIRGMAREWTGIHEHPNPFLPRNPWLRYGMEVALGLAVIIGACWFL